MAKEVADPSIDMSEWDVEARKQRLQELEDDEEPKEVLATEAGGSGNKDPKDAAAAGGSGEGGEARWMKRPMRRLHKWAMMEIFRRGRSPFFMA
ncbi:hypothetical protein Hanom_Chr05g00412341 [Helianthus anomalus]